MYRFYVKLGQISGLKLKSGPQLETIGFSQTPSPSQAYWLANDGFQVKKNVFPHKAVILCADYKSGFDFISMGKWVTPLKAIP